MDLVLCTGAQSCWSRKGPSPNCFHKAGSVKLSKISRYAGIMHPTLCIALGDVWLGCSCSAMETHSMKLSTHCSWANLKATWSLEVWRGSDFCALCASASADPALSFSVAYHFMAVVPNRFHFVITPLTADCGIFSSEESSRLDLLHRWHPITVPRWNSLSSWERRTLSQMFVEAVCMPRCLNLYTCGHGSDWNSWL